MGTQQCLISPFEPDTTATVTHTAMVDSTAAMDSLATATATHTAATEDTMGVMDMDTLTAACTVGTPVTVTATHMVLATMAAMDGMATAPHTPVMAMATHTTRQLMWAQHSRKFPTIVHVSSAPSRFRHLSQKHQANFTKECTLT